MDSLPAEPPGKPKSTGVGSLSLLQQIFPTQESNQGLLHFRRILYQLSYQGSLFFYLLKNKSSLAWHCLCRGLGQAECLLWGSLRHPGSAVQSDPGVGHGFLCQCSWSGCRLCSPRVTVALRRGQKIPIPKDSAKGTRAPAMVFTERLLGISSTTLKSTMFSAAAAKLFQSCPTLCNPIDSSPPGSPVSGILQARTMEWVASSFSNA